jgi:hypothetical protein
MAEMRRADGQTSASEPHSGFLGFEKSWRAGNIYLSAARLFSFLDPARKQ